MERPKLPSLGRASTRVALELLAFEEGHQTCTNQTQWLTEPMEWSHQEGAT